MTKKIAGYIGILFFIFEFIYLVFYFGQKLEVNILPENLMLFFLNIIAFCFVIYGFNEKKLKRYYVKDIDSWIIEESTSLKEFLGYPATLRDPTLSEKNELERKPKKEKLK